MYSDDIIKRVSDIKEQFKASIGLATDLQYLNQLRAEFVGKNGKLTSVIATLRNINDVEARRVIGANLHEAKSSVVSVLNGKCKEIEEAELKAKLQDDAIDVTLPGHSPRATIGKKHILTHTIEKIASIMTILGYERVSGPEIEDEWHNFSALNMPKIHPARQMHDTFYIKDNNTGRHRQISDTTDNDAEGCTRVTTNNMLLRTHTSTVQVRYMEEHVPPIKIFSCGRVYRADHDATHTPMFHQLEILWIDMGITLSHMVCTIENFLQLFFEDEHVTTRLRSSYFPFTEPSFEVDMRCSKSCTASGDNAVGVCNESGWLEVAGCGMVHSNVLKSAGIDIAKYQGFAVGFGVDRLAMLKYGINDLRSFFDSDKRWLDHYGVTPNIA